MNEFVVPETMAISKRIELVTNFQLSTKKFGSENFQIMNCGLGGMISVMGQYLVKIVMTIKVRIRGPNFLYFIQDKKKRFHFKKSFKN